MRQTVLRYRELMLKILLMNIHGIDFTSQSYIGNF